MQRDDVLADLDFLEHALEDRFAYLKTNGIDYAGLFEELRGNLPVDVELGESGLHLQKLLANFIDGHASVNVSPSPSGYLPFVTGSAGDELVALEADRSAFLDAERPFLLAIDGVPVQVWLRAAAEYVAAGSPQLVRRGSQRWLRAVQMLRQDMGLPTSDLIEVTLANANGDSPRVLHLEVAERPVQFGGWPRYETKRLEGNVGYLRLPRMRPEAAGHIRHSLEQFETTGGMVVDVRGNGGGSRDALRALLPALMEPDASARVVNVAAYRTWKGFPDDHLAARHLYPLSSVNWTHAEREALDSFMPGFQPEWQLPQEEFSEWHAMVVSPARRGEPVYRDRPVAVLLDAACFSATDVFLSALKGLPNVTLVGEPSGGGSALAQIVELPASGLKARFASMASFQASGQLFDGHGVQPDIEVTPEPDYYLEGGSDPVLDHAVALVHETMGNEVR